MLVNYYYVYISLTIKTLRREEWVLLAALIK